ncbi:MAG: arylsulfatase [Pirellulaceae bacterium]|nr:MAG: arylsulfatase [Pirellulaceae bacterium]
MNRRVIGQGSHRGFLIGMAMVAILFSFTSAVAEDRPPNIILLLLDDAGWGDFSCYGQQHFHTPHIDRIASEGMRFTQHYSGSTVCAPTRCSLMTGLHTGHAYVRGNREVKPEGQAPMPADIVTIPRLLKKVGYRTGAFGKWGLGAPGSSSDPARHFDVFFGYNCQREAHRYYPQHLWKNFEKVPLDGQTYSAELILQEAMQFVRDTQDQPFFLYLPVTIPHAAMQGPEEFVAPFRRRFSQFEDVIGRYAGTESRNPIAQFAGMMTYLDHQVGQLDALLTELGLRENTLFLITSDNGPHREGGHDPDFFDSNGPFRGYKRDLYEGGIRAPLIARWPGHIRAGSLSELVCAHWDLLPTVCEVAGATVPQHIDGISLVAELTGRADSPVHDYLYWEFYEQGGKRAARFGDWKAVQLNLGKSMDGPIEVYDLATDPGETTDVADQHPDVVQQARRIFAEAHTPSPLWSFSQPKRKKN